MLERISDAWLDRTVGSRPGMQIFFAGMRRRYRPDRAKGFRGEIEFAFTTARGVEHYTVRCGERAAEIVSGRSDDPAVRVRVRFVDFLRVAAGDLDAGQAMARGRLGFQGDFGVATQIGAIFGGKPFL